MAAALLLLKLRCKDCISLTTASFCRRGHTIVETGGRLLALLTNACDSGCIIHFLAFKTQGLVSGIATSLAALRRICRCRGTGRSLDKPFGFLVLKPSGVRFAEVSFRNYLVNWEYTVGIGIGIRFIWVMFSWDCG